MKSYVLGVLIGILLVLLCELIGLFDVKSYGSFGTTCVIDSLVPISPCDNKERYSTTMKQDSCKTIEMTEAKLLFKNYIANDSVHAPFGAWLGKELIDTIFTTGNYNGLTIMLGRDSNDSTCFIIKGSKGDFLTMPVKATPTSYFRLDAMCPAYCDGLSVH